MFKKILSFSILAAAVASLSVSAQQPYVPRMQQGTQDFNQTQNTGFNQTQNTGFNQTQNNQTKGRLVVRGYNATNYNVTLRIGQQRAYLPAGTTRTRYLGNFFVWSGAPVFAIAKSPSGNTNQVRCGSVPSGTKVITVSTSRSSYGFSCRITPY